MQTESLQSLFNSALLQNKDISHVLQEYYICSNQIYAEHSSGKFQLDAIVDAIERIFRSEDQWVTIDNICIWYCTFDKVQTSIDVCNNIAKAIYWLLFIKKEQVTRNHLKYIGLKIINQRLYECDTKNKCVTEQVYKVLNLIEFMFIKRFRQLVNTRER